MKDTSSTTGFVTFSVDCPQSEFPSVRVPWNAEFPFVVLETTKYCVLTIQIICARSQDANGTLIEARAIAERIVRELAFRLQCPIGGLVLRDTNLRGTKIVVVDSQGKITGVASSGSSLHFGGSAEFRLALSEARTEALVVAARDTQEPQRDSDLELFRSALMTNDPVARFILLYAALQQIIGAEYQGDVDDWIRAHAKQKAREVPKSCKNKKATKRSAGSKTETEYTSTRNSLGHVRSGQTSFAQSMNDAKKLQPQQCARSCWKVWVAATAPTL